MRKKVKRKTILIDGIRYYDDKPDTCRKCFFWKNRKVGCVLGTQNCYYLAEAVKTEQEKKCEGCCYAKGHPCVSAVCYKELDAWLRAIRAMEKNPAMYATVPKSEAKKREIWDAPTLFHALEVCEDERLKLAINLAFACSLRIGELLGLTWDCVDISPESIAAGKAYVYVNKELQRVDKSVMKALGKKDVLRVFPELRESNKTVLVLKKPKTATSTRKIFLPKTVAEMLVDWKREQDFTKEALGNEYADFDLVMANGLGMPTEQSRITALFAELIEKNNLPKVVFHSIRHSSITYKLKLNGGDIKSVQGDSGHAQAQMVTDQYSHILDDDRKNNAALFEKAFYSGKGSDSIESPAETGSEAKAANSGVDPDLLAKILSNPEMAALLTSLAKSLN